MIGLNLRQKQALEFIIAYQAENGGVSPLFREIGEAVGVKAKSAVFQILNRLEACGYIRRLRVRHRAIEVTSRLQFLHTETRFRRLDDIGEPGFPVQVWEYREVHRYLPHEGVHQ